MTKTLSAFVFFALLLLTGTAYAEDSGCTRDTECKGERVCEAGRCIAPSKPEPDVSSTHEASAPVVEDEKPSFRVGVRGGFEVLGGAMMAGSGGRFAGAFSGGLSGRVGIQLSPAFSISYDSAIIGSADSTGAVITQWDHLVFEVAKTRHFAFGPGVHLTCASSSGSLTCANGFAFLFRPGVEIPLATNESRRRSFLLALDYRLGMLPSGVVMNFGLMIGHEWH